MEFDIAAIIRYAPGLFSMADRELATIWVLFNLEIH